MASSNSNQPNKKSQRIEEAKVVRKIVFLIFSVMLIVFLGVGIGGFIYIKSALEPVDPDSEKIVEVSIPIGSSVSKISQTLENQGIIKEAKVFRYYIKFKNESGFQAGEYKFSPSMTFKEIIAQLKTGKVMKDALFAVTIPEGKQLEQIAEIISNKTEHTKEEFLKKANDEKYIKQLIKLYPTILTEEMLQEGIRYPLEGYLYPATYDFYEKAPTIETIIEKMIEQTELVLSAYMDEIEAQKLTVHEVLTMASLIEEEATKQSDREKISAVFYNRLDQNMPLQTDPTVLYALGNHQVQITYDDLETESPYNTYAINGLPIGPIANAGETSIQAALNPAETSDLYFYARPNGEVIFTSTLREHNNVKNKYKSEWDAYREQ